MTAPEFAELRDWITPNGWMEDHTSPPSSKQEPRPMSADATAIRAGERLRAVARRSREQREQETRMSDYRIMAIHPKTGATEVATAADNHFGRHEYAIVFADGAAFRPWEVFTRGFAPGEEHNPMPQPPISDGVTP